MAFVAPWSSSTAACSRIWNEDPGIELRCTSSFRHIPRQRINNNNWRSGRLRIRASLQSVNALAVDSGPDLFLLELAEKLEDSVSKSTEKNEALKTLREASAEVAVTCKWPNRKDEAYRFTDVKFLKDLEIEPSAGASTEPESLEFQELENGSFRLAFIDGVYSPTLSQVEDVPEGVYIGSVLEAPDEKVQEYVLPRLSQTSALIDKDAFVSLNGIGAVDSGVIVVPEGVKLEKTVHVVYYSSGNNRRMQQESADGAISMSNPRLFLFAAKGSVVHLIEEFVGAEEGGYWTNSVCEIAIEAGATVSHDYIQLQSRSGVNVKKTYVSQEKDSTYKCVDIELGSKLSRHNLHIEQQGPNTTTELLTFLLCGGDQLQDLHSRLVLNHPKGFARQLQKCIIMNSTGHAVFDGTIRVNRDAQQTDAGQLSRCLLLAPRATINAKPSLQINADDVKCTHGVAISDLEDEQLFYFRARGIDVQTARSALVFSFGAEVIEKLESKKMQKRVEEILKGLLSREGAILSQVAAGLQTSE